MSFNKKEYDKQYGKEYYKKPKNRLKIKQRTKKYYLSHIEEKKIKNKNYIIEDRTRRRNKRREFLKEYKRLHSCTKCGESDIACLDFHHISEKRGTISNMGNINKIKKEIKNCIVLCSNCHRKLHSYEVNR